MMFRCDVEPPAENQTVDSINFNVISFTALTAGRKTTLTFGLSFNQSVMTLIHKEVCLLHRASIQVCIQVWTCSSSVQGQLDWVCSSLCQLDWTTT